MEEFNMFINNLDNIIEMGVEKVKVEWNDEDDIREFDVHVLRKYIVEKKNEYLIIIYSPSKRALSRMLKISFVNCSWEMSHSLTMPLHFLKSSGILGALHSYPEWT